MLTHEKSRLNEITEAEWKARIDLAALYRLTALSGWDDIIFTHISARVPGPDHHFLINPIGSMFEEIAASDLVKVDLDGKIVSPEHARINEAGFTIHSAIHAAREDAMFVVHLHTIDGMAVAAHPEGVLPLNQICMGIMPRLAYHDYRGIAFDLDERDSLVADLGGCSMMMLKHHGTLSTGETAGEAWLNIYALERACALQVRALSGGRGNVDLASEASQRKVAQQVSGDLREFYRLVWTGLLRKLQRSSPGFDH